MVSCKICHERVKKNDNKNLITISIGDFRGKDFISKRIIYCHFRCVENE